jgi:hypothetical protein
VTEIYARLRGKCRSATSEAKKKPESMPSGFSLQPASPALRYFFLFLAAFFAPFFADFLADFFADFFAAFFAFFAIAFFV